MSKGRGTFCNDFRVGGEVALAGHGVYVLGQVLFDWGTACELRRRGRDKMAAQAKKNQRTVVLSVTF